MAALGQVRGQLASWRQSPGVPRRTTTAEPAPARPTSTGLLAVETTSAVSAWSDPPTAAAARRAEVPPPCRSAASSKA